MIEGVGVTLHDVVVGIPVYGYGPHNKSHQRRIRTNVYDRVEYGEIKNPILCTRTN